MVGQGVVDETAPRARQHGTAGLKSGSTLLRQQSQLEAAAATVRQGLSAEGELQGEGKGTARAPAVASLTQMTVSCRSAAPQPRVTAHDSQARSVTPMSPSQAIRRCWAPAHPPPVAHADGQPAGCDELPRRSMQPCSRCLPSLQLQLSDDLQDTLASGGQDSIAATDQLLSELV